MLLPGAGLAVENMSNPAGKAQESLGALKKLIAEIQPNDLKPGNDMSTGLERLRQFIANTLAADTSVHSHSIPKDGLNLNQTPGSFDLANWAKGITQGQENATSINGAKAGEVAGGEKSVEILSAITRAATETENVSKESGSMKAVGSSQIPLQSENPEKIDAAKLNADMRAAAAAHETAKETKVPEKAPGNGPVNDDGTEMAGKAGNSNRNAHFSRSLASADNGRHSGGQPLQENSLTGDSSSVSKLINDAQVEKEHPLKANTALTDDSGSKVVKMEAGTNDSGQLTSQTQTSPKAFEMATAAKETEAGQSALRNQTLEQIVRRAVVQVRGDGQHEARIDLKPDFLGHVHMKIITKNQQVTVKILTEFGFVKDMIENNIHQLKADLQQHGLEVDKVDVSVSRDADGNKHSQQNMDRAKTRQDETGHTGGDNTREKNQKPKERAGLTADGLPTVDYFA
jgi:flagellar hook-length control protein FliK